MRFSRLQFALVLLAVLIWLAFFAVPDNRVRLVFCDVGQGDAVLIIQGLTQILIDGGPDRKVLNCLSNNLPFFDQTLEMVILTHPDNDHLAGLNDVFDKYRVRYFVSGPEGSDSGNYQNLLTKIKSLRKAARGLDNFKIINIYAGEKIKVGEIVFENLWPDREWVAGKLNYESGTMSQGQDYVLGAKTEHKNLNDFSLVFILSYQNRSVLLMGDADSRVQDEIMDLNTLAQIDILKFPHHGSKTGIREDFLAKIKPKIAVISVGKNSFGHPTQEALGLLEKYGVKIRRTDLEGEISYDL